MLKNLQKVLNVIRAEKILKYKLKIYKDYINKFPNLARLAFDDIGLRVSLYGRFENNELNYQTLEFGPDRNLSFCLTLNILKKVHNEKYTYSWT